MKKTDKKYTAFFDLDHTILRGSSGSLMWKYNTEHNVSGCKHKFYILMAVLLGRSRLVSHHTSMRIVAAMWKNVLKKDDDLHINLIFNEVISKYIRDDAKKEIEFHRASGAVIVLLSASISSICGQVKKHLDIDEVLCTELELDGEKYTGRIAGRYCWGKEKLYRASSWCKQNGFSLKDAWYYGDAVEDRHILAAVGYPNCVCPDRKLEKLALKKNWKILMWR